MKEITTIFYGTVIGSMMISITVLAQLAASNLANGKVIESVIELLLAMLFMWIMGVSLRKFVKE